MDTIQLDGVVPNQTPLARRTIARVSKRSRWIWSRVSGRLCGVCFPLLSLYTNQIGMDLDWANDCLWFILVPLIGINTVIIVAKLIWWSEFCRFLVARFYPFQNKNSGLSYYKYTDAKIRALIHSIGCLIFGSYVSAHTIRWCLHAGSATRSTIDWLQAEYGAGHMSQGRQTSLVIFRF